ncbi:uncharacterized protein LOC107465972 [Arachis duranensis]|uniref:Uncharacterized protein LOC107465972 n=1 Tax=Arachis duranensis TaxID=130453 RepID=A0A6P4BDC0_ARADU|nr:uncharacterized protein LOC107465972 [Arachis duranensis]
MERMMKHQELTSENHEALMKNLERQIGQLSKQAVIERPTSSLLSDTILNLKKECKAIQLRSGRTLVKDKETNKKRMGNDKRPAEKDKANNKEEDKQDQEKLKEKDEQPQASRKGKQVIEESSQEQRKEVKIYTPPLPYPQRLQKELNDQQFPKFLEVFKKLEINIPLAEALEQMPLYAKFLKELINKRRSWHEKETIMLTEECSAVIQKGLPPKFKDRRSFFLPCTIENISIDKDLCDLGVSINLIPYSMMRRLCIEEVKSTQMLLELVDKSVVLPKGVIENLLVKVDKFIFPTDFVILDLGEEGSDSIILGRLFRATARAIIDVEQGELTLRVHDESITLNVFPEAQHTDEKKNCMNDDKEDLHWKEEYKEILISSPLKQETSSKAGQKENETVQYDEKK